MPAKTPDLSLNLAPFGRRSMITRYLFLCLPVAVSACSSTHDLKRDGFNVFGGGFIDEKVGPGLYLIKGFSNTSPFATPDSAARTFEYRAKQLCPNGYSEIHIVSDAYSPATPGTTAMIPNTVVVVQMPRSVITSKIGHILCADSPLSLSEAKILVTPKTE